MPKGYNVGCTDTYTTDERCYCLYPLVGNWRFQYQDKAKNAFLSSGHFSGRTLQRYVFFFTMQRSDENIIPSGAKKGSKAVGCASDSGFKTVIFTQCEDTCDLV